MSIITLSATLKLGPQCTFGQRRFDLLSQSDASGEQQVRLLGPPRWTLGLVQPGALTLAEAGQWAALIAQLRGRANVLAAWDPCRPAPQGSMRGTLTLAAGASAGATAISVTGGGSQAGTTLKAGDLLQIGSGLGTSQLVMITADATANGSGVIALAIEPALRTAFSGGAAVAWNQASAYFRAQADASSWTYAGRGLLVTGMALDLMETWS